MALKTLSPFPYYGGKAKMSSYISSMLPYTKVNTYIEPFGGGARVLLNKKRHPREIYNDGSAGLCAFFSMLSKPDTAYELINRLYETEYSQEQFYKALTVRNQAEDNYLGELKREAIGYISELSAEYGYHENFELLKKNIRADNPNEAKIYFASIKNQNILSAEQLEILDDFAWWFNEYIKISSKIFFNHYVIELKREFKESKKVLPKDIKLKGLTKEHKEKVRDEIVSKIQKAKKAKEEIYNMTANNHDNIKVSEIELATATYIIYSQSRDGIGKDWNKTKYKSTDDYHRQIKRLYDVADRMRDVEVHNIGALGFLLGCNYLYDETACFYLDPSYLKPDSRKKNNSKSKPKNLGKSYKLSSNKEDQKLLLETIIKAKAKIIISNYDVDLYNDYLRDWRKIEYNTNTTVGIGESRDRVEILWCNY